MAIRINESTPTIKTIYHITTLSAWEKAVALGSYSHSSLEREGFIHASFERQVERSANKFFCDEPEILLLHIDPLKLASEMRVEENDGDLFPHIYGEINLDAVTQTEILKRGDDGRYAFHGANATIL